MDLSIIIVNWNSADYLHSCLTSVYKETSAISFEIIVVDNASLSESWAALIRRSFPKVILHCAEGNLGFAGGSNLGYRLSTGRALLFLNPDTEVQGNVFACMVEHLTAAPDIAVVGSRLLNSDGSLQISCIQTYPTILNQVLDCELLRRRYPDSPLWGMRPLFACTAEPARVDVVSGACLMIKRDVFAEVGEFDERYFMYVEDVELCRRVTSAGYTIRYLNKCEVIHHGGKSSASQGKYFVNLRQQEAMLQFFSATEGWWYSVCYRVCVACVAALRVAILLIPVTFGRSARKASNWKLSFGKWVRIFQWALGWRFGAFGTAAGTPAE